MTAPSARRGGALDPDALAALEEERDFLLRSIDDLDREHAAGDVEDEDYVALRDDYTARAAAAIHAIEGRRAALAASRRPRRTGRTAGIAAAVLVLAGLAGWGVARAAGDRSQGEQITGGVVMSLGQQLTSCLQLSNTSTDQIEVLECYDDILAEHPASAEALTYRGWYLLRQDLDGMSLFEFAWPNLVDAVAVDPDYADARVFRAIALKQLCRPEEAAAELAAFDATDPLPEMTALVEQQRLRESIEEIVALRDAVPSIAGPPEPVDLDDMAAADQCLVLFEAGAFEAASSSDTTGTTEP